MFTSFWFASGRVITAVSPSLLRMTMGAPLAPVTPIENRELRLYVPPASTSSSPAASAATAAGRSPVVSMFTVFATAARGAPAARIPARSVVRRRFDLDRVLMSVPSLRIDVGYASSGRSVMLDALLH